MKKSLIFKLLGMTLLKQESLYNKQIVKYPEEFKNALKQ